MQNTVYHWLRAKPGLEEMKLETLEAKAGGAGLFCQGSKVLSRAEDILGNVTVRQSLTFKLCLHSTARTVPAFFLALNTQDAPILGEQQTVTVTGGHMTKDDGRGFCRFEATVTFTFTRKE